jgi:Histidine kinase-, DNA gyrase B-, and HSP90-like ATPase
MAAIAPLPLHTRSILRSTIILTSLVQLVSELIQNSLDANARSIDVGIDCDEWSCVVQDDGDGMSKNDLDVIANVEQPGSTSSRYSTSKSFVVSDTEPGTLGFRGEGTNLSFPKFNPSDFDRSLGIRCWSFHSWNINSNSKFLSKLVHNYEGAFDEH